MELSALLDRLNKEIDSFNQELVEAVETGEIDDDTANVLRVKPGSATVELVYADSWPLTITRALDSHLSQEHPREIIRMAKSVKQPTKITRDLQHGSVKAKGFKPVLVKTLDLAHLHARATA